MIAFTESIQDVHQGNSKMMQDATGVDTYNGLNISLKRREDRRDLEGGETRLRGLNIVKGQAIALQSVFLFIARGTQTTYFYVRESLLFAFRETCG